MKQTASSGGKGRTMVSRFWLVALRVSLGWVLLYAGLDKLFTEGGWSATGYLSHLEGPFASWFSWMAGNAAVDWLNMLGLTLVGLALVFGFFTRFSAFWGFVLMLFYYLSGYPFEHSFLIDEHVVYMLVFALFMAGGAGSVCGLDKLLISSAWAKDKRWIQLLAG
ncbi:MAG: DoxX family protein [Candidatus Doudnabacteria bacterium]|nr:DoxX family protein [Candidatus Doudnabacteria bacterium]